MSRDACEVHEAFSFWVMAGDAKVLPHGLATFRTAVGDVAGMWVAIVVMHLTVFLNREVLSTRPCSRRLRRLRRQSRNERMFTRLGGKSESSMHYPEM